jgi:hypothetical protein
MSGAFLSQYIALMRYEIAQYSPDGYVIFINSSDVLQSFVSSGRQHSYYFQYSIDSTGGFAEVRPNVTERSSLKDFLLLSSTVRYLKTNAQVSMVDVGIADENANFSTIVEGHNEIPSELFEEADFLLNELNSFGKPVLIVADCPKEWIYEEQNEVAFNDVIVIRSLIYKYPNVSMIELAEMYVTDYSLNRQHFGLEDNPHWSSLTNEVIAQYLYDRMQYMLTDVK